MSRLRAVIFDLDDTLYPEEAYVLSGFRAVASFAAVHLGCPADRGFRELSQLHYDGIRGDTFDCWLANQNVDPDHWTPKLLAAYREHRPMITCFDGAHEMLEEVGQKYSTGLITDGWFQVQQAKINALNIAQHFQSIVISDQWGRNFWKPHERPYLTALAELEAQPHEAIYVADNPKKDFIGARGVGLRSIRMRHVSFQGVYADEEPVSTEYAADAEINNLEELVPAINGLLTET